MALSFYAMKEKETVGKRLAELYVEFYSFVNSQDVPEKASGSSRERLLFVNFSLVFVFARHVLF